MFTLAGYIEEKSYYTGNVDASDGGAFSEQASERVSHRNVSGTEAFSKLPTSPSQVRDY